MAGTRILLLIGRRLAWRHGVNVMGTALATGGLLALSFGLLAGVLSSVVYDHRADVSRARSPHLAQHDHAQLMWRVLNSAVDEHSVDMVAMRPITSTAPLPPGVPRWPGPGEAVLSPALRSLLATHQQPERYGRPVGMIGSDGLVSSTELLVYVQLPSTVDDPRALSVGGFGAATPADTYPFGDVSRDRSIADVWLAVVFLLVMPGLLALVAAPRVEDAATLRRRLLLDRIGASRRAQLLIAGPRWLPAMALSLVTSAGMLTGAAFLGIRVPMTGAVVSSELIRSAVLRLLGATLAVHLVGAAVLALAAVARPVTQAGSVLVPAPVRPARWRPALLLATLAGQPWLIARFGASPVGVAVTAVSAAVTIVCLPAAIGTALQGLAVRRARAALRKGSVGRFVGWRITAYHGRGVARLAGAVAALVIAFGHVAAAASVPSTRSGSVKTRAAILLVEPRLVTFTDLIEFAGTHHLGLAALTVTDTIAAGHVIATTVALTASCTDLQALDVACHEGSLVWAGASARRAALQGVTESANTIAVMIGTPEDADDRHDEHSHVEADAHDDRTSGETTQTLAVLVDRSGGDLDGLAVAADAYRAGLVFNPVAPGTDLGVADMRAKSKWLKVFGVPGLLVLLLIATLTWAAAVVEEGAATLRHPMFIGRTDVVDAIAAVRVALPVALAGVAGAAVTEWLLAAQDRLGELALPTNFLVIAITAVVSVASVAWWGTRRLLDVSGERTG